VRAKAAPCKIAAPSAAAPAKRKKPKQSKDPDPRNKQAVRPHAGSYKWIALSNTTLGMLMAMTNSSIVLISLPAIFNGIHLDPLTPSNALYLLWMLMGYTIVTAVLVVSFGRIGDIFGRVRMYNLGFAVFTAASIGLSVIFGQGSSAAVGLIALRAIQGIGGALIMSNSVAILTDAFPENERGFALGINGVAALAGSFIGLVLGGLLAVVDWHLVFLVSVPFGIFGTIWAYLKLEEIGTTVRARIDWIGNILFAVGLVLLLAGITGGIQPYGSLPMSWTSPPIIALLVVGAVAIALFIWIEQRITDPMFHMDLFRNRAFAAGNLAGFLAFVGRGGLMFILIIWLQGIWLPLHGYSYASTPLWAGIYMLPQTMGFLVAGPISGYLSDRYGARPFATAGMIFVAISFVLLLLLQADFAYVWFALILLLNGLAMGLFSSPNSAAIMNSVPAERRGAAAGMRSALQNAGMTLSIGLFFSLIILGLAQRLPQSLYTGLTSSGIGAAAAHHVAQLPPVGSLFAAFLGFNPMQTLLHGVTVTHAQAATLYGRSFFPHLISTPFMDGMHLAFIFSIAITCVAAVASYLRGPRPEMREAEEAKGPVVAISASMGSGGTTIAQAVAEKLRMKFVDRLVPLRAVESADIELERTTPQQLVSTMSSLQSMFGASPPGGDNVGAYRDAVENAVCAIAREGNAVVLGRGAAVVLHGWPNVLRVRIDGPFEHRAARLMELRHINRQEAERIVRRADALHAAYIRHLYDRNIRDSGLYDITLDGTELAPDQTAELIASAAATR
jgi:MFS family permease